MTKNATAWKTNSGYGTATAIDTTNRITELGDTRITESGDIRILNSTTITRKASTAWDDSAAKAVTDWTPRSGYGSVTTSSTTNRTTEAGDTRITEAGDTRILNETTVTPKAASVWEMADTKDTTPWIPRSGYGDVSTRTGFLKINGTDYLLTTGTSKLLLGTTVVTPKASTIWEDA